jgi:DNA-directed RNA polymerase
MDIQNNDSFHSSTAQLESSQDIDLLNMIANGSELITPQQYQLYLQLLGFNPCLGELLTNPITISEAMELSKQYPLTFLSNSSTIINTNTNNNDNEKNDNKKILTKEKIYRILEMFDENSNGRLNRATLEGLLMGKGDMLTIDEMKCLWEILINSPNIHHNNSHDRDSISIEEFSKVLLGN